MPVYVDPLMNFGWKLRGREIPNCHMFTDEIDLTALHELAAKIGMKRAWFQDKWSAPHYDLTPNRRADAIEAGAIAIEQEAAVAIWRARRQAVGKIQRPPRSDQRCPKVR